MSQPQRRPATGSPEPVLITDAQRSYEEELKARKRRYGLMMGMRIPCMILATVFYQTPWLAVALLVLSIPLPWMAVLIANDRLPRKREEVNRFRPDHTALEARPHPVIEAARDGEVVDGGVVDGGVVDGQVIDGEVVDGHLIDRDGVDRGGVYRDGAHRDGIMDGLDRDARRAG